MQITIDDNFKLDVPRFTDEYRDLVELYKLNFGGWHFESDNYDFLSNKIIDSNNTDWDKAIALTILNQKLLAKIIFTKTENGIYPLIRFQHHITYIVEFLAVRGIRAFINQRNTTNYRFSTYIGNSVQFSTTIERLDQNNRWVTSAQRKSIAKKKADIKEWNEWHDFVIRYRRKYGEVSFERLPILKARIKHLERISGDAKKETKLVKTKINQLNKIKEERTWWWANTNYTEKKYDKLLISITNSSDLKDLKRITTHFSREDFERTIELLQKDIEEYQNQVKLAKNLGELKEEYKSLLDIEKGMENAQLHPKAYLAVENVKLFDPTKLSKMIDSFAYCRPTQEQAYIYSSLKQDIEAVLNKVKASNPRGVQALKWRYLIPNPHKNVTSNEDAQRSLQEVGEKMGGITAEGVRQTLAKVMYVLRRPEYVNVLFKYIDDVFIFENMGIVIDNADHLPCSWKD